MDDRYKEMNRCLKSIQFFQKRFDKCKTLAGKERNLERMEAVNKYLQSI